MKKYIALCLILVLLILPFGSVRSADATAVVYGDVSCDGKVSAEDALLILQSVVGKITLTEMQRDRARVTAETGDPDANDALDVLRHVVGKLPYFLRVKEEIAVLMPTYALEYRTMADDRYEHVQVVETYEEYRALCNAQLWLPDEEAPQYTADYFETANLLIIGARRNRLNSPITVELAWVADRVLQVQLEDVESCLADYDIPDLFFITEIAKISSEYDTIQFNVFHLGLGCRRDNPDCWRTYSFEKKEI